jgi:hypothetical protein
MTLCVLFDAVPARAQTTGSPRGRLEVAIGAVWTGPIAFSNPDANERDRDGSPYRLFAAEGSLRSFLGYGVRLGFPLTDRFQVEAGASYALPQLAVRVSHDVEAAASADLTESVQQIQIDGGVVANLGGLARGRPSVLFVTAGVGYLRELHEGQTLAVHGRSCFAGVGVRRLLRTPEASTLKAVGVRLDARFVARSRGAAFDDGLHVTPAIAGSLFLRF